MKKIHITILALLIAVILGYVLYTHRDSSVKNPNVASCEAVNTESVYSKASNIESRASTYTTTTKDVMGQSTEGGQQTNYLSNGKLVLIKQIFFGETGKSEINFYIENDKVFYVKKTNTEYLLPISEDSSAKTKSVEVKDFLLNQDQKLCSWYKNKELQVNDSDTEDLLNYLVSGI